MACRMLYLEPQRLRLSPPRARSLLFFFVVPMTMASSLACGGAEVAPAAPSASVIDADGGEATCEDRARVAPLCVQALTQRCRSQSADCEATCDSRGGLPGNTMKSPTDKNEHIAVNCRQECSQVYEACLRTLVPQCPQPCS